MSLQQQQSQTSQQQQQKTKSALVALINKSKQYAQLLRTPNPQQFIDVQLYELLKDIFYLLEENKQSEMGLGDGGSLLQIMNGGDQTQKLFIECLFHTVFCQNTFMQFKKSRLQSRSINQILRQVNRNENGEHIDTNNVKKSGNGTRPNKFQEKYESQDNFSSQFFKNNQRLDSNNNLGSNIQSLFGEKADEKKTLYDVAFDMSIYILLLMHENDEGDINYEVSSLLLQIFIRHIRMHQAQNAQMQCLQAYLAMNKLFQNSKHLMTLAKEKDVLNVIFSVLPSMFREEAAQMNQHMLGSNSSNDYNLNSLVIGQGFQGAQGYQSASNINQQHQQQIIQGLQSGKSSVLQNQPSLSPMNLNSKNEEEKRGGNFLDRPYVKKLSFNRASSEPPSANKNAVVPVEEVSFSFLNMSIQDLHDEDIDYDNKGSQDVDTNRNPPRIPGMGERTVPPLMMSQVQSVQNQIALQQQNSSNSVMNNYFNGPINGQFNTTMNQNNNAAFKLNFIPQNTLAKSRITRRQMSMSRKHTQKLGSVSNFAQIMYGDETSKNKDSILMNHHSYDLQLGDQTQKSSSQQRKGPVVPKLNINSIVNESSNNIQRIDALGLYTTTHAAQLTHHQNQIKSSNRSNQVSAYSNNNFENQLMAAQQKMNSQMMANYQTNTNVIRQQINESDDHNISIYDEINGSFVDDMGDGQNPYVYDNAEEKLRQLAIQLGESCLTNDLAALISQKREIELIKSARKTAANPKFQGYNKSRTMNFKTISRSISVSYTAENIFKQKSSMKDLGDIMNQVTNLQNQRLIDQQNQRLLEQRQNNQRARIIALNIAYQLLKKYDIHETRFLKHPIQALNSYISSDNFHDKRHLKQILALENQSILIDSNIDQEMQQNGKIVINSNGKIINLNPTKIQFQNPLNFDPSQLPQITEANQSDTEEVKDSDAMNTLEGNDESRLSHNIYSNQPTLQKLASFFKIDSKEKLSLFQKNGSVFNSLIYQEEKVIFKIYKKFTFVNEDILRRQVMNELATFAAKDKSIDQKLYNTLNPSKLNHNSSFANGLYMVNNLMNHTSNLQPPISGTPIRSMQNVNNLSFDDGDEDFYFKREQNLDAITTLSSPNNMWLHNGIAYEVNTPSSNRSTAASTVSKERIRKKLDVLLYTIDRRIKFLIQQYPDKTQTKFAEDLRKEICTLNAYLEQQNNRIMLYQFIEVCLESILMVKKCLVDIGLKTNIFVMDFSKHISTPDLFSHNNLKIRTPNNQTSAALQRNAYLIDNQKAHRLLFAEFLSLVSKILKMTQTQESMKLLNEVLVFDEQWCESVKTYSISLFLSDIVSTISIQDRMSTQNVSLMIEELRGINLINFDEPSFISQIMTTQNLDLYQMAKESIYHLLLCSLNMMRYFKSVLYFYNNIIKMYFSNYGQYQNKYPSSGGQDGDVGKGEPKNIALDKKPDFASGQKNQNADQNGNQTDIQWQKYWKLTIRRMLYQYMYLITPPNGLLSQYLHNNSINYVNLSHQNIYHQMRMASPSRRQEAQNNLNSYRTGNPPLNFKLTKSVLSFTKLMFNIPDKFTKYVFIEELMLFYIRVHYISFVRLYNKNYTKKDQILTQTKDISLNLCKKHLECLFCIAKNRNEDTRRKLYQFKVVQFLTQEIELEFDVQQRRQRFIELSKEEQKKIEVEKQKQQQHQQILQSQNNDQQQTIQNPITKPKMGFGGFKLNLTGVAGASLFSGIEPHDQKLSDLLIKEKDQQKSVQEDTTSKLKQDQDQVKQSQDITIKQDKQIDKAEEELQDNQNKQQKKLPFGMKKLNIAGLGLSELTQDNQQQQINMGNQNQLQEEQKEEAKSLPQPQTNQPVKKMPFAMPKLNVAGLGLSELIPDQQVQNTVVQSNVQQQQQQLLSVINQEQPTITDQIPQQQQQVTKKLPFSMPKLKVEGLGLTELTQDLSLAQQNLTIQSQSVSINTTVNNQNQEEAKNDQSSTNQTVIMKKPALPFKIPSLNVAGLGLSELVKDDKQKQAPIDAFVNQQFEESKQQQMQQKKEQQLKDEEVKVPQQDQQQQTQQPQKKLGFQLPKLNITGLTLSELIPDKQEKIAQIHNVQNNQEEMKTIDPTNIDDNNKTLDYGIQNQDLAFQKQPQNFDKTAPLKLFNIDDDNVKSQSTKNNPLVMQSQESAQFLQNVSKHAHGMIINIPEEELDDKRKQMLMKNRVNLLQNRKRSLAQSNRSQEQQELFMKKNLDDKQLESNQYSINTNEMKLQSMIDMKSNTFSPNNFETKNTQINQTEQKPTNKLSTLQIQDPLAQSQPQLKQLTASMNQTPVNQSSRSSTGSYVGRNKVFIPFLKFPEDIHIDPSEKIKVYQRPDDNRYKLMKTKENATPEIQRGGVEQTLPSQASASVTKPKGIGKRGKMLNVNTTNNSNQEGSLNSSGDNKDHTNQRQLQFNFNFGSRDEDDVKINKTPVNIPRPERKDDVKKDLEPQIKMMSDKTISFGLKKPLIPLLNVSEKKENIEQQKEQDQEQSTQNQNQDDFAKTEYKQNLQEEEQKNSKFQLFFDKKQDSPQKLENPQLPIEQPKSHPYISTVQKDQQLTEANFYMKERNARPIYQDEELHVLMISLLTCLLLKPERGILDDLYCSQFPIDNGKQNILFLLHHHMNHPQNQPIIQKILDKVSKINPPLAGQRLLKLLCSSLFDLSLYNSGRDWKKIGDGAYANVYEAETNLSDPQTVAIKQMLLPGTIYDRCVLHDIFTEITCLEELRLEQCVTDLFDYGVDNQCYYIVQKRYACSLRQWRLQQQKSLNENLSIYLSIYKEFLKSLQTIHSHNVTHYDIKCDNVLIDASPTQNNLSKATTISQDDDSLKLAIADFGECKIFSDEKDELCQRNRGTDYYKSPEMLQLTLHTRKDTDKYDRRKQVGTNRLSDIWSAGCLFFELLTGQVLFYNPNFAEFLHRVTSHQEALFTQDKLELIHHNVYLIDFLKYMLVRDSRLRPSIDNVVKRFEHVHALLVSTTIQGTGNNRFSLMGLQPSNRMGGRGQNTLDHLLDQAQLIMVQNSLVYGGEIKEETLPQSNNLQFTGMQDQENYNNLNLSIGGQALDDSATAKNLKMKKQQQQSGSIMHILEDIYLVTDRWLKENQDRCVKMGITHIIIQQKYSSQSLKDKFDVLEVQDTNEDQLLMIGSNHHDSSNNEMNPFMMMTSQGVMDYLRRIALQRGKVAFVENVTNNGETVMRNGITQRLVRECLLICLNHIFQTSTYETYTLIRSQNLFFRLSSSRLATLSKWSQITTKINQYMQTFPRFQCLCGQCLIILKRQYANYQSMQTTSCNCCQYYKNVDSSQCPSPGCTDFIKYLKTFFKPLYQQQQSQYLQLPVESLNWGFVEEDDFILGPNYLGQQQHNSIQKRMVLSNMSQTIDKNSVLVSITEKKSQSVSNVRGGLKEQIDYNMISKSSATVKNYGAYTRWKLYKCKDCHVWTHAVNELENRYAILLNNRVKETQSSINLLAVNSTNQTKPSQVNISNLNAKQQQLQQSIGGNNNNSGGVRVPILQKIKLSLPF